jgi:hypothetical protein
LGSGGYQNKVDEGGMHGRAGGTSAASPVVGGIAALYLEANPNATYQNFIDDLLSNAYQDAATGAEINSFYGFGKVHGLNTLLNDSLSTKNYAVRACGSYTLNGQTYTQTGVYSQTLTNHLGKDSVITVNVEIQNSNNQIVLNGQHDLSSLSNCGDYQWYNCDLFNIVPGENTQNYTPASTASYAMILSQGVCVDTSECILVQFIGIDELKQHSFYLSPNPTSDQFKIHGISGNYQVELMDFNGKKVDAIINKDQTIDISRLNSGMYFVKIIQGDEIFFTKIQRL